MSRRNRIPRLWTGEEYLMHASCISPPCVNTVGPFSDTVLNVSFFMRDYQVAVIACNLLHLPLTQYSFMVHSVL